MTKRERNSWWRDMILRTMITKIMYNLNNKSNRSYEIRDKIVNENKIDSLQLIYLG